MTGATKILGLGVFCLVACSGGGPTDDENSPGGMADADTVTLTIPETPAPRAEHLVTTAVSTRRDIDASGVWRAEATLCQNPAVFQLIAQDPVFSAIILFALPEGGDAAGTYQVLEGTTQLPDSGSARVGMQVYPEGERPAGFVGFGGSVEIESLGANLVGHLAVVAEDARYFDTLFLSAAFDIPVHNASDASCRVMGERLD